MVHIDTVVLTADEKEVVLQRKLNDIIINCSQNILHHQFPQMTGFFLTLKLKTMESLGKWQENFLEVCHCRDDHWITVTTKGCNHGDVLVYDTLFSDVDPVTAATFQRMFNMSDITYKMIDVQKQKGIMDCGVLSIANATALAFDTTDFVFNQD
jgi:hypothetical protein